MLTLTDDKLLKFVLILGKSCVAFVWGEKLGWPRTLFIILLYWSSRKQAAPSSNPRVTLGARERVSGRKGGIISTGSREGKSGKQKNRNKSAMLQQKYAKSWKLPRKEGKLRVKVTERKKF